MPLPLPATPAVPSRHRGNTGQAPRQPSLADQHLHAVGQWLHSGLVRQFVDEAFDEEAIVAVRHATPGSGWHWHWNRKMVHRQIGYRIGRRGALNREHIMFTACSAPCVVGGCTPNSLRQLAHRRCSRDANSQPSNATFAVDGG